MVHRNIIIIKVDESSVPANIRGYAHSENLLLLQRIISRFEIDIVAKKEEYKK